jgi:hypothetical protein
VAYFLKAEPRHGGAKPQAYRVSTPPGGSPWHLYAVFCADFRPFADRYSSIVRLQAGGYFGVPKIRALYEATYFAGLRKAGMPEE